MRRYMVIASYCGTQQVEFFNYLDEASDYMLDAVNRFQANVELYRYDYDLRLQTMAYHLISLETL